MRIRRLAMAIAFATAAGAAGPALAVTEVAGTVFGFAQANLTGQPPSSDSHIQVWSGSAHDLSVSVEADRAAIIDGVADNASAFSQIDAHWASADAGSVTLSNRGFLAEPVNVDEAHVTLNTPDTGRADWSYAFVAKHDGLFLLNFDISGTGDDFGLGTWDLLVIQDGSPLTSFSLSRDLDFDTDHRIGQVNADLAAGHNYLLALRSRADLTVGTTDDRFAGRETDRFDWRITGDEAAGVPEPSAWSLAIVGLGLAGSSLRRRRAAAVRPKRTDFVRP